MRRKRESARRGVEEEEVFPSQPQERKTLE